MAAARVGNDDIAVRLSSMGSSLTRKDVSGETALDYAHSDELRKRMRDAAPRPGHIPIWKVDFLMKIMKLIVLYVFLRS